MADIDSKEKLAKLTADASSSQASYPWKSAIEGSNDRENVERILEHRASGIRRLYETANENEQKRLEEEWISLVIVKDQNLRDRIQEHNESVKREYIEQLYTTLQALGTFEFDNPRDIVFKRNLAKMYHQVEKYCTRTYGSEQQKSVEGDQKPTDCLITSAPPCMPPPPPPPPLPVLRPAVQKDKYQRPEGLSSDKPKSSLSYSDSQTPTRSMKQELLQRIQSGGCLSELKATPCKRSPGGTPVKRRRHLSESDTSDLITIALKRKFQNAMLYSPTEHKSPNVKSPSSEFH